MFQKDEKFYKKFRNKNLLLDSYNSYMNLFINKVYPEHKDKLIAKIKNQNIKDTRAFYIDYPSEGNMEIKEDNLLNIANYLIKNDIIITPSGACYVKAKVKENIASSYISEKKAERSKIKKLMFKYYAENNIVDGKNAFFKQLSIKRSINAASGVANRTMYFKSIVNYNAITGSARSNVISGYAIVEALLGANRYFKSYDEAINYILSCLFIYPGDDIILKTINEYVLKIPDLNDVKYYIYRSIYIHDISNKYNESLDKLLDNLSPLERTFVFYCQCLNNIFFYNSKIFLEYFNKLSNFKEIDNKDIDISQSLFDLEDEDLLVAIITASCEITIGMTLDDLDKELKSKKKIILNRYYYVYNNLKKLELLMDTFILVPLNIESLFDHTNMLRSVTLLSDTDSNIFTTIHFVHWFTNDIKFTDKAMFIHGMIVYLVVKSLEHVLNLSVKRTNVDTKNIKKISMKNEFLYKILIRTILSKHYVAGLAIQEGVVYDNIKIDIKGKNLKASDLAINITSEIEQFSINLIKSIIETQSLNMKEILETVIKLEYNIYNSLKNGETKYVFTIPIKNKFEYDDPLKTQYFTYILWEDVFSKEYGHMEIPSKVNVIKLRSKISYKNTKLIEYIKLENKMLYDRLIDFLKRYPNKKIDIISLPLNSKIPKILLPIIAYREIIHRNLFGLYLLLQSLGITYIDINNAKKLIGEIFSDLHYD